MSENNKAILEAVNAAIAIANIRGGSEYSKAWHEAGRRQNKQNVFDDFIAAGEYLKALLITPQDGLAIQSGSNGGLLIGAVVNQRPDLPRCPRSGSWTCSASINLRAGKHG